jgi:predicted transcriptional regulator
MFYNNSNNNIITKKKKNVRFSIYTYIHPNPTILDMESCKYLWWTEFDKSAAYFAMFTEIQNLQRNHPTMTMKQAMKLLYQPNNLTRYDPNNFIS